MIVSFYLFQLDRGQCGALRLPDGGWCLFDLGCSKNFSPVLWLEAHSGPPWFHRLTLSHLHYYHLADYLNIFRYPVANISLVDLDQEYLAACLDSCSRTTAKIHVLSCWELAKLRPSAHDWQSEGILIQDRQVPLELARRVSHDPQAQVDNAGLVTRIEVYGLTLLLTGDLQREVWEPLIRQPEEAGIAWREFLSNVDILVAPYHGQPPGFSSILLALARPRLVLIPATDTFPLADSRYFHLLRPDQSVPIPVLSTAQHGHLRLDFHPPVQKGQPGLLTWTAASREPPPLFPSKA